MFYSSLFLLKSCSKPTVLAIKTKLHVCIPTAETNSVREHFAVIWLSHNLGHVRLVKDLGNKIDLTIEVNHKTGKTDSL